MIRLIIFDFDDTLTDNRRLDRYAFIVPCKKLGLPIPKNQMIRKYRKKGYLAKDIMKNVLNKNNTKKIQDFLDERKKFLNSRGSMDFLDLKNYSKYLLYFIKRKKIKMILCTSRKNKRIVIDFLKKKQINQYFSKFYFMEDFKINIDNRVSKNRIIIKKLLLGKIIKSELICKEEIMFVGNSYEDFTCAKDLGIRFIMYQNSYLKNHKIINRIIIFYLIDIIY